MTYAFIVLVLVSLVGLKLWHQDHIEFKSLQEELIVENESLNSEVRVLEETKNKLQMKVEELQNEAVKEKADHMVLKVKMTKLVEFLDGVFYDKENDTIVLQSNLERIGDFNERTKEH